MFFYYVLNNVRHFLDLFSTNIGHSKLSLDGLSFKKMLTNYGNSLKYKKNNAGIQFIKIKTNLYTIQI